MSVMQQQQQQQAWGVEEKADGGAHMSNRSAVSPPLEEMMAEETELPVPADGMIPLSIPIQNDTEILMIDVSPPLKAAEARRGWTPADSLVFVFRLILGTVTTACSCSGATPPPVSRTCRFRGPPHLRR